MNISKKNVVAGALIVLGLLLMFGAAGESDMYDEMGAYFPIGITFGKATIGIAMVAMGALVRRIDDETDRR